MNIIEIVSNLNFPKDSYVVVGSGHLIALGLKDGKDVDIVVTQKLFDNCMSDPSWEHIAWTYPEKTGQIFLRRHNVELYKDVNCGNFNPTIEELLNRAVFINGIPFASLQDILSFKKEYSKTNSKHFKDIALIEEQLALQQN